MRDLGLFAGKLVETTRTSPLALTGSHIFQRLTARVEIVPFPIPFVNELFSKLSEEHMWAITVRAFCPKRTHHVGASCLTGYGAPLHNAQA